MPSKTIEVQKTENRIAKNEKPYLWVLDTDGKEYSLFKDSPEKEAIAAVFSKGEGSKVMIDYIMSGQYANITKAVLTGYYPPLPGYSAEDKRLRSMCLSYAKDLTCSKEFGKLEDTLRTAETYFRYINGEIKVSPFDVSPPKIQTESEKP